MANRNDPTATTAAISADARTNGRPSVVTGPGSGSPVAVSASASDSADSPAAVAPASTATPPSSGHTGAAAAAERPWSAYQRMAGAGDFAAPALPGFAAGAPAPGLRFAVDELLARDLSRRGQIVQDAAQFPTERVRRSSRSSAGSSRCWSATTWRAVANSSVDTGSLLRTRPCAAYWRPTPSASCVNSFWRRSPQEHRAARRRRSRTPRRTPAASRPTINGRLAYSMASISSPPASTRASQFVVPRHFLGDVGAESGRIGEVEVELQQVPQPHRLGPERFQPVTFGAPGMCQRQLGDRGLQERVDDRVAVERRGVLVLRGDAPYRFAATVDTGDRMSVGQRVHRRPDTFGRAQPQRTVRHRSLLALQVIQRVLQRVVQLVERQRERRGWSTAAPTPARSR